MRIFVAKKITTYDIFHDENKEDGFWHSFIFIPRNKSSAFFNLLLEVRNNLNYYYPIHFTDINKKTKLNSVKVRLVKSWISILYYAIQEQKINADIYLGHKFRVPVYRKIKGNDKKIGAKFVVLREKDNLKKMFDAMSYTKKVETTFRMGLKGGSHYLFQNEIIRIGNIYVDHPPDIFKKNYNSSNIIDRFKSESKDNIKFTTDSKIIPINKKEYKQKHMHSEFMQLADIAVGAIRTRALKAIIPKIRYDISFPFEELLKKEVNIKKRMKNSRFNKAFSLSDAWIENEKWQFSAMKVIQENKEKESNLFGG